MSSENKKIKAELQKKKAINLRHKGRSSSKEESEGGGGREWTERVLTV